MKALMFMLGAAFGLLAGFVLSVMDVNDVRQSAAKAGAGRYVVDPVTGKTRWEWITPTNK